MYLSDSKTKYIIFLKNIFASFVYLTFIILFNQFTFFEFINYSNLYFVFICFLLYFLIFKPFFIESKKELYLKDNYIIIKENINLNTIQYINYTSIQSIDYRKNLFAVIFNLYAVSFDTSENIYKFYYVNFDTLQELLLIIDRKLGD